MSTNRITIKHTLFGYKINLLMLRTLHVMNSLNQGAEGILMRLLFGLDQGAFNQSVVYLTGCGVFGCTIEAGQTFIPNILRVRR